MARFSAKSVQQDNLYKDGKKKQEGEEEGFPQHRQSQGSRTFETKNDTHERDKEKMAPDEKDMDSVDKLVECRPQTKEEIERELERLFFAGKAKCHNGHVYERICMMGPCPICNGLQYQFSPDEPLFDYDYEPDPRNDDEIQALGDHLQPPPSTSSGFYGAHACEDEVYDQIEHDRLLAAALQAEDEEGFEEAPSYRIESPFKTWPWLRNRKEAEKAPPAPPESILPFYIDCQQVFDMSIELEPRAHVEHRFHKGFIMPPFPSLTMDEKLAVFDARSAKQEGPNRVKELVRSIDFRVILETSKRYHRLNPVPVTLKTNIRRDEFRLPRDRIWAEIKAKVEEEMEAKARKKMEVDVKKLAEPAKEGKGADPQQ